MILNCSIHYTFYLRILVFNKCKFLLLVLNITMETPQIRHFSRAILTAIWYLVQEAARGITKGQCYSQCASVRQTHASSGELAAYHLGGCME